MLRSMTLLFCLSIAVVELAAQPQPQGPLAISAEASDEIEVRGQIHFYGDRYILKEKTPNKWLVLLETAVLEELIDQGALTEEYVVEGELHLFRNIRYLLPREISSTHVSQKEEKRREKSVAPKKDREPRQQNGEPLPEQTQKWTRKLAKERVEEVLEASGGVLAGYRLLGKLNPLTVNISKSKRYRFDFAAEMEKKGTGDKVVLVVNVTNRKRKIYSTEAKKFVAAGEKLQSQGRYSQMVGIYLSHAGFSSTARRHLAEHGVHMSTIRAFVE